MRKSDYAKLYTKRADGRYQGYYRDEFGVRHTVCDKDPEALYWKIEDKKSPPPPTFRMTAEAWEVEHVEKLERSSQATYRAPLRQAIETLGDKPVAEITAADIDRVLLQEKAEGYSYKHAALTKSIYKQVLDYAIIKGYISINPATVVKVPRGMGKGKILAPEDDQEKKICAAFGAPFGDFAAVLYYAGVRTEEAVALQWGDIDRPKGFITVERAADLAGTPQIKDTKTESGERQIPIMPQLRPYIVKPSGAKMTDLIFHDKSGGILTRGKIRSRWVNWCKVAGLAEQRTFTERHRGKKECTRVEWYPLITPHQLRHGFATAMFEAEIDELTTQSWMGHKDISTTHEIYVNLRKKHAQDQIAKLEGHFGQKAGSASEIAKAEE